MAKDVLPDETLSRYISLLTDFGFKRIFGEEANKDLLIDFLNSVLSIDGGIKDLEYGNPEKQGRVKTDSKVIFDLYCTTGKGERIIIEMQKLPQKYYKDRSLYYATFPIQEQGEKRKRWNFSLHPVYSVNIVNFNLEKDADIPEDEYISYVELRYRNRNRLFSDKMNFVFLELPRFPKKIDELQTNVERWTYVLRYLHQLEDIPATLLCNEIFKKLFEKAAIANMTKDEITAYNRSLKKSRDMDIVKMEMNMAKKEMNMAKIEIKERDKTITILSKEIAAKDNALAAKDNTIAAKDNTIAAKDKRIAELERQLGVICQL